MARKKSISVLSFLKLFSRLTYFSRNIVHVQPIKNQSEKQSIDGDWEKVNADLARGLEDYRRSKNHKSS
ncbi:hypothetical protein [Levilactobacillus cerevisiae]|uniref:hypothetical protein n=1 Tax=Levilactobacillus cerevisiae TaxID=1704076 RepID=UPI000F7AC114|nr:hypothetical protein [Levilactobacillus cerevisiae]